ncbi:lysophosphatidylcholine acyltransferase 1 isoform X3 [Entelurus aequoreus]|uniref:lysophosphatidylcholine acyltransferase 1 isoform X3 n=1 Tax=Entelurus aequoreus TaxID=161455 RepID=UPI002B1D9FB3|nr:lysophosphatidylcholine acyltransferase 1 isoform X3 [Entelurus aequoreus]
MNSSASRPSRWARNPFVHNLELSLTDKMTMGLMSVTVFPVRLLLVSFLMLLGWPFAFVASLGRSEFVVEPQSWWRRLVDVALRVIMRAMWFCAGFHWVKVKGERAAPSQAAILTVAPHSTFFDAIPVTSTMCSIVAKLETQSIPVWGTLIQYIRPVLVLRSNLDSRRQTVEEIKRRARSGGEWPQIMIFPEGTCTNRSSLILFKAGAFLPGLPVQPVVLRYPNKLYLPVYTPSDQEKENPSLFANNVRKIMAKALEVPLTDLSFEDRELSFAEGPLKVYDPSSLLEFNHLLPRLRLKTTESSLQEQVSKVRKLRKHLLTLEDFALFLHVGVTDTLRHIHGLFNQQEEGQIDIRHYLLALSTIYRPSKSMDTLKMAFEMYDSQDTGQVHERDLAAMLEIMLGVKQVELSLVLMELGGPHNGKVTYDELWCFMAEHPHFVQDYLDFKDHPRHLSVGPHDSCNGHMTPDDTR